MTALIIALVLVLVVWSVAWLRRRHEARPLPRSRPADTRPGGKPKPPTQ